MTPRFPVARRLLARVFAGDVLESISGDLDEEYTLHIRPERGRLRAWAWYWRQTLRSIRDRRDLRLHSNPAPDRGGPQMLLTRQHLHYAVRSLRRSPITTSIAIATIALGIGASAVVFSVVNAALLRPLPYGQADQVVMMWESNPQRGFPTMGPTPANLIDWKARSRSMADIAALAQFSATLTGSGDPRRLVGQRVEWHIFELLQAAPMLGRAFLPEEDAPGHNVVIVSHALWVQVLGSDPNAVGRQLMMNGQSRTVVGVMPPGFRMPPLEWAAGQIDDMWVPMGMSAPEMRRRGSHYLNVVGRLAPGVTLSTAREEMKWDRDPARE
jgi:putative ABC transport system permease protein